MLGNVSEWVEDCYEKNYVGTPTDGSAHVKQHNCFRIRRGGSWVDEAWKIRSANRLGGADGNERYNNHGFRVARDLK